VTGLALYFAGAEVPTWRKLLIKEGVKHVAVTYRHLLPRIKGEWRLEDHFPDDVDIFLDSGAFGINKKRWTPAQQESFLNSYLQFVQTNWDRVSYYSEADLLNMGADWVIQRRLDLWHPLGLEKFVPVWHEEWPASLLREMVERYPNVGVPSLASQHQNVLASLVRRTGVRLHGLSFAHPHAFPSGIYSSIVSSSWTSPTRWGETVIWDHNRLRRYSSDEKDRIRRRHRQHFAQAGFDADKICADDSGELARYTIWAWRQLEASMTAPKRKHIIPRPPIAATGANGRDPEPPLSEPGSVDLSMPVSASNGHDSLLPVPSQRVPLPVFDFRPVTTEITNPDGPGTVSVTSQVAVMKTSGLRQCSSCSLAAVCPEFTPAAECKYEIPIEIRNRDQLIGILSSLLEMQGQRVAFGFWSEQLQGGYPDQNVSLELDRFMRMTESVKNIQDTRDFLKVSVEGRAEPGLFRRLFGGERAEMLHQVDPTKADRAVRKVME